MSITPAQFDRVRRLIRSEAGIVLEDGKQYLVEARLGPVVRQAGLPSIDALIERLGSGRGPHDARVVEAMTTNETIFFRDVEPFEVLRRDLLPALVEARRATRRLSIWCGAASTGQEPYSIAMTLAEHFPELATWQVEIRATDINEEVLARARAGRYTQLEINRGLPATMLVKYFEKKGLEWQIAARIRDMVRYEPLNLMRPFPAMPAQDIVFLRNVLIYFDVADKQRILGDVRRVLRPDGYLFLGAAETTRSLDDAYERLPFSKTGCYRLGQVAAAPRAKVS